MAIEQVQAIIHGKKIGGQGQLTKASGITFDNTGTDLVSENVEDAIVEVNAKLDRESVSVTADGVKTTAQLLVQLAGLVDFSKLNEKSVMNFDNSIFPIYSFSNGNFKFNGVYTASNSFNTITHEVSNGTGTSYLTTTGTSSTTFTNRSSNVMTSGAKITIIY